MSANIQHSSAEDRWYTPLPIVELAREVLKHITLDPASDEFGNSRVQADRFYTEADDGLVQPWTGTIFLNPPGGVMTDPTGASKRRVSKAGAFWRKLQALPADSLFEHAIFVAFSLEQLSSTQKHGQHSCADFPLLVPSSRLRFDTPSGAPGAQPSHANAIVYVPGTVDVTADFVAAASRFGSVLRPARVR